MPAFKPKFSIASQKTVSKKQDVTPKATELRSHVEHDEILQPAILKDSTNIVIPSVKDCGVMSKDSCKIIMHSEVEEIAEPKNKISSLTEKQYDDIIDIVVQKAAAGQLIAEANDCDADAVKKCLDKRSISPNMAKMINEKTPTSSPVDNTASSVKLLKKKPVKKKKSMPQASGFLKRKSLNYSPSTSSGKTQSEDKENTTSNLQFLTHRRKVLNKGVWVQCDNEICMKWRYLPHCSDPSVLPNFWTCSMNAVDDMQNKCSDPEIDWSSCLTEDEDHFVYTDFNAGSIVWARMQGYPAWPAMVDSDPDTNLFYDYDSEGKVHSYHVVFLDNQVSRAWVSAKSVKSYTHDSYKQLNQFKMQSYFSELKSAISCAEEALQLSLEQRLEKYNFEKRYLSGGKCQKWMSSRRPKTKSCESKLKLGNQVVPDENDCRNNDSTKSISTTNKKLRQKASLINSQKNFIAEKLPMKSRLGAQQNERIPNKDSLKVKSVAENQPAKPSFKALQNKAVPSKPFQVPSKPNCSISQISHDDEDKIFHCSSPAVVPSASPRKHDMKFDPDIYTMEMSEQKKQTELVKKDGKIAQPFNGTAVETKNSSPLSFKNDDFSKDFWQPPEVKEVPLDSVDPFVDLDIEEMGEEEWGDEEMKHLDELMPVIADHLSA